MKEERPKTPREVMELALDDLTRLSTLPPDPSGHDWIARARLGLTRPTIPGDQASTASEHGLRPVHSDPTGETVANRSPDDPTNLGAMRRWLDKAPAEKVSAEIERRLKLIRREVGWLVFVADASIARPATAEESKLAEMDNIADKGCSSCQRIGEYREAHRNGECQWCQRWARDTGQSPPALEALQLREAGLAAELRRLRSRLAYEAAEAHERQLREAGWPAASGT